MLHDKIIEIFFATDNFCNEFKNEFSKLSTQKLPRYATQKLLHYSYPFITVSSGTSNLSSG